MNIVKKFADIVQVKSCKGGYRPTDKGIVFDGDGIARYEVGDFKGKCLIYCHGNGEVATSSKFLFDILTSNGFSVVAPDYRGYGLSMGEFTEEGVYEAARSAYNSLIARGVKPQDIVIWGYSLGSCAALDLASTVESAGLILQTPFASGQRMADHYWKSDPHRSARTGLPRVTDEFRNVDRAAKVRVPTLVFHGTVDSVVPYEQGEEVYKAIGTHEKRLVTVDGGNHCDFQRVMGFDKYVAALVNFTNAV